MKIDEKSRKRIMEKIYFSSIFTLRAVRPWHMTL